MSRVTIPQSDKIGKKKKTCDCDCEMLPGLFRKLRIGN
jgi:hypothetical protein